MRRAFRFFLLLSSVCLLTTVVAVAQTNAPATQSNASTNQTGTSQDEPARWSETKANAWYAKQPWPVGADYIPRDAINQLEMWQAATFNPQEIDQELGWAQAIGMNTMRVFLHDLLWQQDAAGFQQRINTFLTIANKHKIRPIFVLFDSCWEPNPKLGPQHPPIPGVHNSGWVQGPGMAALADPTQYPRLQAYVEGVVGAFANDPRILAWDLWNEPDNGNDDSYDKPQDEKGKNGLVAELLPQVFSWARSQRPIQPLTSGVFYGDWDDFSKLKPVQKIQIGESDILSFHNYSWPEEFEKHVVQLETYHRPIFCTEYMARSAGSTFDTILPIAMKYRVAAINWGLVNGKTQTNLPWDSWQRPYVLEKPPIWFHDVFYPDGKPYRQHEVDLIRQLTSERNGQSH
ncbi:MAG TPA: 1,4-beta-xylanase [Acidobacteriaceae bacterium]|nr:1,4-beta-xylanase [Acidobacteriaceae bacterium]